MRYVAVCMAFLTVFAFATPAQAGIAWCRGDPVVMLNGTVLDISVAIPVEYVPMVNGPVAYTIQTPPSVTRAVLVADVGYGHGSNIMFTDGAGAVKDTAFPVRIDVVIPINKAQLTPDEVVPVELTVLPANGNPVTVQGTSDRTTIKVSIHGK